MKIVGMRVPPKPGCSGKKEEGLVSHDGSMGLVYLTYMNG